MARTREPLADVVFWVAACALLFVCLGVPSFRGSEDRFAEISREMSLDRDYFHPTLNGESHFHKPLLSYWAILTASVATGALDEWSARLPSALAGLLALAATIRLGTHLWGPETGRLAGWLLLSSYGFLFWARTAAADLENLAAIVLAVAWFRSLEDRPGVALYAGFAAICAIGAHAKGLAAIVLPPLVLVPHLGRFGRWRDHVRLGPLAFAAALGGALYLAPFLWAEISREGAPSIVDAVAGGDPESGLYMVFQENVRRFYAPHDHREPPYIYLVALPILLLPWSLVFLAAGARAVRESARLDPETRWLLWSIGLIFAVFTLSGSRRSYYVLPILPFCSILLALGLAGDLRSRWSAVALGWTRAALAGVLVLEGVAAVLVAPIAWLRAFPVPRVLCVATLGLVAAGALVWRSREAGASSRRLGVPPDLVQPLALAVLVLGGFFLVQYPLLDRFRTEKPFAHALAPHVECVGPERVAFVQHVPALFPFYVDAARPLAVLRDVEQIRAFREAGPGWIVASPRSVAKLGGAVEPPFDRPPDLEEGLLPWGDAQKRLGAWRVGVLSRERGGAECPSSNGPTT